MKNFLRIICPTILKIFENILLIIFVENVKFLNMVYVHNFF